MRVGTLLGTDDPRLVENLVLSNAAEECREDIEGMAMATASSDLAHFATQIGSTITGSDLINEIEQQGCVSTGCSDLDDILGGGGLCTGEIYEIYGLPNVGKTQIALSAMANLLLDEASKDRDIVVIEGIPSSFPTGRLAHLLQTHTKARKTESSLSRLLDRVKIYTPFNIYELLHLLWDLRHLKQQSQKGPSMPVSIGLVIVDGIFSLLSPLLGAEPFGHCVMGEVCVSLRDLSLSRSVPVLLLNAAVTGRTTDADDLQPPRTSAMGGPLWQTVPDHRLVVDSPRHPVTVSEQYGGNSSYCEIWLESTRYLRSPGHVLPMIISDKGLHGPSDIDGGGGDRGMSQPPTRPQSQQPHQQSGAGRSLTQELMAAQMLSSQLSDS
eukprot:Clim_evm25s230 gene=Clim_evmTU25s230